MSFLEDPKDVVQHGCYNQSVKTSPPESFSTLQNQVTCQHALKGCWQSQIHNTCNKWGGPVITLEIANGSSDSSIYNFGRAQSSI